LVAGVGAFLIGTVYIILLSWPWWVTVILIAAWMRGVSWAIGNS